MAYRKVASTKAKRRNPARKRARSRKRNPSLLAANPGKKRRKRKSALRAASPAPKRHRKHRNPSHRLKSSRKRRRNPSVTIGGASIDLKQLAMDAFLGGGSALVVAATVEALGPVQRNVIQKLPAPIGRAIPGLTAVGIGLLGNHFAKNPKLKRFFKMHAFGGAVIAVVDAGKATVTEQIKKALPASLQGYQALPSGMGAFGHSQDMGAQGLISWDPQTGMAGYMADQGQAASVFKGY